MEEKRRDAGSFPPANSPVVATPMETSPAPAPAPVSAEPASTRRRGGAQKRKASNGNTSSNSTPLKRLAREKAAIALSSMHNGPYTRAAAASSSAAPAAALQETVAPLPEASSGEATAEEGSYGSKDWQALEAAIEAEYEAIRSRDVNSHVVPTHCGWFSWTKVHPLEEQTLPSFFTGKSENRTSDVYLEIRNWIMKKYHANPNTQIELKDLSELTVGDLDARQEVMEFLDHWGLINFHPFPPTESATTSAGGDEAVKTHSLVENLYRFETVQSGPPVVQRTNIATPAVPSGLFPEPAIAEDLVKPEKPEVEYHCNSCSADCSRKRYHCQTQADYDLCTECFNNGKFGSAMSSSDFILMEPAEVPGVSGGNWTDQETLLLLEALELYKENWNEIAEHVATKTKAQCILHFVQMPIEDTFLDCNDEIDADLLQNANPTSTNCTSSVPKDASKTMETKHGANEDQPSSLSMETSKPEDADEINLGQETGDNFAVKALREAFEAVGSLLTPGGPITFVEAGNPVMALAAFLARLVGPDIITASSRCSIKSISCSSPSMQIAARHCFVLEDPPDVRKEPIGSESSVADMADQNAQNDENQKEEKFITVLEKGDPSHEQSIKNIGDPAQDGKAPLVSSEDNYIDKSDATKESDVMVTEGEVAHSNLIDSSNSELLKDHPPGTELLKNHPPGIELLKDHSPGTELLKDHPPGTELPKDNLGSIESQKDHPPNTELLKDQPLATELLKDHSPSTDLPKDQPPSTELLKDPPPSTELRKDNPPSTELPKDHPPSAVEESDDIASKEELGTSSVKESGDEASLGKPSQPTEAPKDADLMSDLVLAEKNEPDFPVTSNAIVENEANAGNDQAKECKTENHDATETKEDHDIDNIKRAAITALSAAAVKAKLLANQEEDQIRQLATLLIDKQLHKLETKLACFNEMDSVVMRVREQLERSRQKLYHERAQIIAARLGLAASSSRTMAPSLPTNRVAMNFANLVPRPSMSMISQRPLISRPMMSLAPPSSNLFASTTAAGSSIRPSSQDKLSSVGMK